MISVQVRKLLWSRSGNRCAICNALLTSKSDEGKDKVIGEEAHIISGKVGGPRYEKLDYYDMYDNLILLCPTCHEKVDKDSSYYTKEMLIEFKNKHESSVEAATKLDNKPRFSVRYKKDVILRRVESGKELVDIAIRADAGEYINDEPKNDEEGNLIQSFLEVVNNLDIFEDQPEAIPKLQMELTELIRSLNEKGFFVAATRESAVADMNDEKVPWYIAHIAIARVSGSSILEPMPRVS